MEYTSVLPAGVNLVTNTPPVVEPEIESGDASGKFADSV